MKHFRVLLLATLLAFVPARNSKALVSAGLNYIGLHQDAFSFAVMGVGSISLGVMCSFDCGIGELEHDAHNFILIGLLLLDENSEVMSFSKLSNSEAKKLGVSFKEASIYNSELEEANILLEEVASSIDKDSDLESVKQIWRDLSDSVSPETYKIIQKISAQTVK